MPAVLCAANEAAVDAFLAGRLPFTEIVPLVADVLAQHTPLMDPDLAALRESDRWARAAADNVLRRRAGR
jgi:1-deoxy-D-xylulose-5-phosphate reductoisomerase